MWAVSNRFLEASRWGTGTVVSTADLLVDGQVVERGLAVTAGSVTMDASAAVRRSGTLALAEPARLPVDAASPLAPFGAEIRVWSGIDFGDGSEPEMVPLITGPIQETNGDLDSEVTQVTFDDRSRWLIDDTIDGAYTVTSGVNMASAIAALAQTSVPWLPLAFAPTAFTAPALTFTDGDDRWQRLRETMAASVGCDLAFDGLGQLVLRPIGGLSTTPVWIIDDDDGGAEPGVLTGGKLALSRRPAVNKVIATGGNSSTDEPYRATAIDDNPASPTFYDSKFRHKTAPINAPGADSQAATQAAADAELERKRGVAKSYDVTMVPNRALVEFDVVGIKRRLTAAALDEVHVLERLSIDLSEAGDMSATTRTVQVAA